VCLRSAGKQADLGRQKKIGKNGSPGARSPDSDTHRLAWFNTSLALGSYDGLAKLYCNEAKEQSFR
jgi:hypothetical protein